MTTHLSLQRMLLPTAQVSSLTTGSITLPSARGAFVPPTDYHAIATVTAGGGETELFIDNIPATYRHLEFRVVSADGQTSFENNNGLTVRFNSNSGSNYSYQMYRGNGTNSVSFGTGGATTSIQGMDVFPSTSGNQASEWGIMYGTINDYTRTSSLKSVSIKFGRANTANGGGYSGLLNGYFNSTSAITSISFFPQYSFRAGSYIALYGIKGS